jgi:hypothetical protein
VTVSPLCLEVIDGLDDVQNLHGGLDALYDFLQITSKEFSLKQKKHMSRENERI